MLAKESLWHRKRQSIQDPRKRNRLRQLRIQQAYLALRRKKLLLQSHALPLVAPSLSRSVLHQLKKERAQGFKTNIVNLNRH